LCYPFNAWIRDATMSICILEISFGCNYAKSRSMLFKSDRFLNRSPSSCTPVSVTLHSLLLHKKWLSFYSVYAKFKRIFCKEMRGFKPLTRPSIALSVILSQRWKWTSILCKRCRFLRLSPNIWTPASIIPFLWLLMINKLMICFPFGTRKKGKYSRQSSISLSLVLGFVIQCQQF